MMAAAMVDALSTPAEPDAGGLLNAATHLNEVNPFRCRA